MRETGLTNLRKSDHLGTHNELCQFNLFECSSTLSSVSMFICYTFQVKLFHKYKITFSSRSKYLHSIKVFNQQKTHTECIDENKIIPKHQFGFQQIHVSTEEIHRIVDNVNMIDKMSVGKQNLQLGAVQLHSQT